jgi:hypothetical protein
VAALSWLLFLVAFRATDPDDGADIGVGLIGLLALPLSVASSVTLLTSLWPAPRSDVAAVRADGREARIGRPPALTSLVLLVAPGCSAGTTVRPTEK